MKRGRLCFASQRTISAACDAPCSKHPGVCTAAVAQTLLSVLDAGPLHSAASLSTRSTNEAHDLAFDSCESTSKIVDVSSTARRNRNHTFNGTLRTSRTGASAISSTTNPNPPPCNSKSSDRKACSSPCERTHKSFGKNTPEACELAGSNASCASTSAQASEAEVRAANAECKMEVFPEHGGP